MRKYHIREFSIAWWAVLFVGVGWVYFVYCALVLLCGA